MRSSFGSPRPRCWRAGRPLLLGLGCKSSMSPRRDHHRARRIDVGGPSCSLQHGSWTAAGETPECPALPINAARKCDPRRRLFHFQPDDPMCNSIWPSVSGIAELRRAFLTALQGKRLRLIGDSMMQQHYDFIAGCLLNCSTSWPVPQKVAKFKYARVHEEWKESLMNAGFSGKTSSTALHYLRMERGKEDFHSGCSVPEVGGHVDYRRVNRLGSPRDPGRTLTNATAAILHALVYLPHAWGTLTPHDVVLMNFGIHRDLHIQGRMRAVLEWWSRERRARRAPRLLWRQTSPQHWKSPLGIFRDYEQDGVVANRCSIQLGAHRDEAFAAFDLNVTAAIRAWGVSWAAVLPTFGVTWDRSEDHAKLKPGATEERGTVVARMIERYRASGSTLMDCTHNCPTGSVVTFWTQALTAALSAPFGTVV